MLDVKEFLRPQTPAEARAMALAGGRYFAGGTDLIPLARDGKLQALTCVDIMSFAGDHNEIRLDGDTLYIGALARLTDCAKNEALRACCPPLAGALGQIGSVQIRNRATIGGNIVHASPAADSAPVLVAAGASLILRNGEETREILLEDFLTGPGQTTLAPGELLVQIKVPVPPGGWRGNYWKVGGRTALSISIAALAYLHHEGTGSRVAYGAVTPAVRRANEVETLLDAGVLGDELADAVNRAIHPIQDVRASGEYRRMVCVNLTQNANALCGR